MDIKEINLNNLTEKEFLNEISSPISESIKNCLNEKIDEEMHSIWMAAYESKKMIGFLFATATKNYYIAELKSIFVEEKWRIQGIGTSLLVAFEDLLIKKKCSVVTTLYEEDISFKSIFEHILAKKEWMSPIPVIYRYLYDGASFKPEWVFKHYKLPSSLTLFFWKDLKEEEKLKLLKQEEQGNILSEVSPFLQSRVIEPLNSLGLKNEKGEIIGWMITERINPLTIRYSALFIDPAYRFRLNPVQLLIESIKIQKNLIKNNHPAIYAVFDLNLNQTTSSWHHFIEKRLKPHALKITPLLMSWKSFLKEVP